MIRNRNNMMFILLSILMSFALTACGTKEGKKTKEGFEKLEATEYEAAMDCFEAAVTDKENKELAYRGIGIAYIKMAEYDKALESFETALSYAGIFAGDAECEINMYMAYANEQKGSNEEATKILDAVIKKQKSNTDAYYLRGKIASKENDYEAAVYNFDKALLYTSEKEALSIQVYQDLTAMGFEEKGLEYLDALLENKDKLDDFMLGTISFYKKDYETARNCLESAKQSDKKNQEAIIYMLGQTYEMLGDLNYASVIYTTYLEEHPDSAKIWNCLGMCKMELTSYEEALSAFETGLNLVDYDSMQSLKYNQITTYEFLGQFDKAKQLLAQYLQAYPNDSDARREYKFLETR